jgi:hypothetical protein
MATKNGDALVTTNDVFQSAISAAMARIAEVGKTSSLIEIIVQEGWRGWDESAANIVVSDSSESDLPCLDDDEEEHIPQAA